MIVDRLRSRSPDSRLLPAEKLHGPTVAVTAIMTFAMVIVAAAGLALANAAAMVVSGVEHRYVVQLPANAATELPRALAAIRSTAGVRSATPVPQAEMRRTLERWLGEAASSSDLPVPALITIELQSGADAGAVEAVVRQTVPQASIAAESVELKPLLRSIRGLQWLATSLVLLMATATGAAIVLASRGALDTHRSTVEIMHGIGATDIQVTKLFERKIAIDALAGAVAGTAAAALILGFVGGGIAAAVGELGSTAPLHGRDFATLALIPVAAVILAVAVARRTLLTALRSTL